MTRRTTGQKAKTEAPAQQGPSLVRHFAHLARMRGAEGSHPATMAVVSRPRVSDSGRRVAEYARIARGHLA